MAFLGENVKKARERLKLTQAELAHRSGMSPGSLGDLERGRQMRTTKIHQLAKALGMTAHDLERGTIPDNPQDSVAVVALSEREEELLRLYRAASPAIKRAIEGAAGKAPEPSDPHRRS